MVRIRGDGVPLALNDLARRLARSPGWEFLESESPVADPAWIAALRDARSRGLPLEFLHRSAGGEFAVTLVPEAGGPLADRGPVLAIIGISPDSDAGAPLRQAAERLERILRGSTDGAWEIDMATGHTLLSDRWWEMLGYGPGHPKTRGTRWQELCHPEDLPRIESLVGGLSGNAQELIEVELRLLHRDGAYRIILARAYVKRDGSGRPLLLSGLNRDVTEQRRVEHALRESEQHLRRLFDSMNSGFSLHEILYDQAGRPCDYRFLEVNAAFEKLTGLRRADLVGRRVLEVLPETEPIWIERFCQVAVTGRTDRFQNFSRELGRHYEVACYSPKPGQFAVLTFDVTERIQHEEAIRERETRFLRLIENASDLITIVDLGSAIVYQSPSIERALGYRTEDLLGRDLFDFVHPEDAAQARGRFQEAILNAGKPVHGEFRIQHKGGGWRTFAVVGTSITGQAQVLINSRDVTDQRTLETALRQSQKIEAVGRLSGGIAHDFNNLLTALKGYGFLLQGSTALGAEERDYLGEMMKAVDRASRLTKQLLAFSRQQAVTLRPVQLNPLVSSVFGLLSHLLGEAVRIELQLSNAELPIMADTGMMEQVLLNLAVNARDAMPEGGSFLVATEHRVLSEEEASAQRSGAQGGGYAVLRTVDNGCGIPADVIPRIFEPFFTTKPVGEGTGLGLAMVHGIVHQHGGWITVKSSPGAGSTFEVFLPTHLAQAIPAEAAVALPPKAAVPRFGTETILVVEDEAAVRDMVILVLTRHGYRTLAAADGFEGLVQWRQRRDEIKLLLTDVVMPGGLGGHELAKRLLQDNPSLPVICVSGHLPGRGPEPVALPKGAVLLRKPFHPSDLAQLVRSELDRAKSAAV